MLPFDLSLNAMGLSMPEAMQQKAFDFLRLLKKWNKVYNLTAIHDLEKMITHHLLDSLSIAPFLQGNRILDVGTGAGFPGIPLALYYPDKQFTLLDSNGKKTRFLVQATAELNIQNVAVIQERVENYRAIPCFDVIIFRAVRSIPEMIAKVQHLCCEKGRFLAMKATYPAKELKNLSHPFTVKLLRVPGLNAERHVVIIEGV